MISVTSIQPQGVIVSEGPKNSALLCKFNDSLTFAEITDVATITADASYIGLTLVSRAFSLEPLEGMAKKVTAKIKLFIFSLDGKDAFVGLLNPFEKSWKTVACDITSFVLYLFTCLDFLKEFGGIEFPCIQATLIKLPLLGAFSLASTSTVAICVLYALLIVASLEKNKTLTDKNKRLIEDKCNEWSSFNKENIEKRIEKYEIKIIGLIKELKEHKQGKSKKTRNEISVIEQDLRKTCQKRKKWKKLKKDWEQLDPKALEAYRVAKLEKWENKRIKNRMEKESNIHSLIGTVINLSSVAIGLLSGSFPAGILTVPTVLFGLKAIKTGISTNRFFIKRSIKKMNFQLAQAYYKPSIKPQKLAR